MMIVLVAAAAMATANADGTLGRWKTPTDNGIIEIISCGTSICGRLVTSDQLRLNPELLDKRNKDPGLRSRRLQDVPVFNGFTRKDSVWDGGTIYNGQDGGTYKGTVELIAGDRLKVKGCIVWPLCKTQTWTRAE